MKTGKTPKSIASTSGWKERLREEEEARIRKEELFKRVLREADAEKVKVFPSIFQNTAYKAAPRLFEVQEYKDAIARLDGLRPHLREVSEWKPKGKSRETLFTSLTNHCLGRFSIPPLLIQALFDTSGILPSPQMRAYNTAKLNLVKHVGAGGSLWDFLKTNAFLVPLTKKQCHMLVTAPTEPFMSGVRRIQVKSLGGSRAFFHLIQERWKEVHSAAEEAFRVTVIEFFTRNPMVPTTEVGPLLDYIQNRWAMDNTFTLKGRSVLALQRGMEEWHADLGHEGRLKALKVKVFQPSGFREATYDLSPSETKKAIWRVSEVITAKELQEEGRRMAHCVFSYHGRIAEGYTSIWSLTMEDGQGETGNWALLTIEVHNNTRDIVQVRGRFNRAPTREEMLIVQRWAGENNLRISTSRW